MKKAILLTLLCLSMPVVAGPLPEEPHVYVEGSAEIRVVPEQMTITVGLSATNPRLAVAKKDVDTRSNKLIKACVDMGISRENLATTALHVSPAYEFRGGERLPLGTRVYRQVDITLTDLEKYPDLMAALVDAKISNTVSTKLEIPNEKVLTDKALIAAIEDARQRAEAMAKSLGKNLGEPYSISEFDMRANERNQLFTVRGVRGQLASALAESDMYSSRGADEPFEPGIMIATAQVYVVFTLE